MRLYLSLFVLSICPIRVECDQRKEITNATQSHSIGPSPNWAKEKGVRPRSKERLSNSSSSSNLSKHKRLHNIKPFLHGLTYFPCRVKHRNCSLFNETTIRDDLSQLSRLARNIQVFDLYCDSTRIIVRITRENKMGLIMGVNWVDQADYDHQIQELLRLLDNNNPEDLSHIRAVTISRTSMINKTSKGDILERVQEIAGIVNRSKLAGIPITMISDSDSDKDLWKDQNFGIYFDKLKVISARPQSVSPNPDKAKEFFDGFVDGWSRDQSEDNVTTIYTEFGYPSGSTYPKRGPDGSPVPPSVMAIIKLACLGKEPWNRDRFGSHSRSTEFAPRPEPEPGPPGPRRGGPPPHPQPVQYFYHSAYDIPFRYPPSDARHHWGLADYYTRQLKEELDREISSRDGPPFGSPPYCKMFFRNPEEEGEEQERRASMRQWVAIGVSFALALLAVIAMICFIVHRYRKKAIEKKKSMRRNTLNSNAYVRTLASYLNRSADSYIDLISKSEYEHLSALVSPEWLIDESDLKFEEVIGEGHFGIVQRAELSRYGEKMNVAVKKLHVGAKNIRQFLSEGILMEQFHHTNVLPLIGISFTSYYLPMIITPFMQKGDLLSYLKNGDNRLTVRQLLKFALEIAEGMRYTHELKLIHRDLAARNCMLDDALTVKIADFGLCRDISDSESYQTTRPSDIPIRWMPPETIEKLEWTHKSDVWSYGVVLWELFTRGKQPYTRVPLVELRAYLKSGGRLPKPDDCPDMIYDLMKTCWHGQAEQRPNFPQLCDMIPNLVLALEGDPILDVPDYYNSVTMLEMNEQNKETREDNATDNVRRYRSNGFDCDVICKCKLCSISQSNFNEPDVRLVPPSVLHKPPKLDVLECPIDFLFPRGPLRHLLPFLTMPYTKSVLVLLLFLFGLFLIAPTFSIVLCKCTGAHCSSDTCLGDFCTAARIEAGPGARKRWRDEPSELYVRGCLSFHPSSSRIPSNLINNCYDYDETYLENEYRKICVCSGGMCNDGPLVNISMNPFGQRECTVRGECKGEYCMIHRNAWNTRKRTMCMNRTLPMLEHWLTGMAITPSMAPGLLRFPSQLDGSVSVFCSDPKNCSHLDPALHDRVNVEDGMECPAMFARMEHTDDPDRCVPARYGACRGVACLDVQFNVTSYRGHVIQRRYRGCVLRWTKEKEIAWKGQHCDSFISPATNVTVCLEISCTICLKPSLCFLIWCLLLMFI